MFRRLLAPFAIAALFLGVAACSDDTQDDAEEAVESAKDEAGEKVDEAKEKAGEGIEETKAYAAAQELRARMKANDTANEEGVRSVAALEESTEDLMGDPDVTGIEDGDGDGLDDDGKVKVDVDDSSACLTLHEEGEYTTVEGGAC